MEYTHGTKWVLIQPVNLWFTGEFQVESNLRMSNLVQLYLRIEKTIIFRTCDEIHWWKNLGVNLFLLTIL